MTPRKDWTNRILHRLSDGDWHRLEPLIQEAMRLVPPGEASREGIKQRERIFAKDRRRAGLPPIPRTKVDTDFHALIASGARVKVTHSVKAMVRKGTLEIVQLPDGERMIRCTPQEGTNLVYFRTKMQREETLRKASAL